MSEASHAPTSPSGKGSTQKPTSGLKSSLVSLRTLKTAAVWFLWLLGGSEKNPEGYTELEGPGAE